MPHSSGGGSHGGGFHGGGFSGHHYGRGGGSNHPLISRTPIPGSSAWLYYTRAGVPHIVYSTVNITKFPKGAGVVPYIVLAIFALAPIGIMLATAPKHPTPLRAHPLSLYDDGAKIIDNAGVLSPSEEEELMSVFSEFQKTSGVTPSVYTVNNERWASDNWLYSQTLEDYAFDKYVELFGDENHWLIVYSCDEGTDKGHWAFEGMQGNNTDSILFGNVTDRFNHNLGSCLDSDKSVGKSLIDSFNLIIPDLLNDTFYIEPEMLVFTIVWELFVAFAITSVIVSQVKAKQYATAQKIENPESIVMKKCKHCGASYYQGTVQRCPKCGRSVVMDDELDGKF